MTSSQTAAQVANASPVSWRDFGWLAVQLAALTFLVFFYRIENDAFARFTLLTAAGFGVHYFLPFRLRLPFLVTLSLVGLILVLGPVNAAWVVGIGLALIGIAHTPVPMVVRAGMLAGIGVVLAVPRWGLGHVPWSSAIWPILGSMFVFRMMSYLYDVGNGLKPGRPAQVLAYFFLLPNVCFPLFPLVDFKRFVRGYYDSDRHRIYQVGVEWIWRGLLQLIAYRLIYFHLTLDPVDVENIADLAGYIVSTYLLYVRLSGYFHIVVGMLHLFGFNLPETHHRYLLASSFTDFWRRINIYWKDFMLKVVYYPIFFRLRAAGEVKALAAATIVTFVATWFLHMAQWFWIRGSVLVEWNDIAFWAILGALVLVNSLIEARSGRPRAGKGQRTIRGSAILVGKTVAMFVTISILWSFWSAESITDWSLMVRDALALPAWPAALWSGAVAGIAAGLVLWTVAIWKGWERQHPPLTPTVAPATVLWSTIACCVVAAPPLTARFQSAGGEVVDSLRLASSSGLNKRDAEDFQRGYYENLIDVSRFNTELWNRYQQMPADFVRSLNQLGITRPTGDEQEYEMMAERAGNFVGALVRTNRWGMRDGDYEELPSPETYRIALLGPSTAMGSGVERDQSFEALFEQGLNAKDPGSYEVLNFAVAGYSQLHNLFQLSRKVMRFHPQAIVVVGHALDVDGTATYFVRMISKGTIPGEGFLKQLARDSGITPGTGPTEARRRMKPLRRRLQAWVYGEMVRTARAHDVKPIFLYFPLVTESQELWRTADRAEVLELARAAGFDVMDLNGAYGHVDPSRLWIALNDVHPNALGSQLLADKAVDVWSRQFARTAAGR